MNTLSTLQSTITKSSKSIPVVIPYPVQPTKLRLWYKFAGNINNSAPNYSTVNHATAVNGGSGSQTQSSISPALPNGNTSTAYMNTFAGGGSSSGSYSYMNLYSMSGLVLTQGLSYSFWIYSTKTGGGDTYIMAMNLPQIQSGNFDGGFAIANPSGSLYQNYIFNYYTGNNFQMLVNTWQHCTVTINSSNIYNVYVNGTKVLNNITNVGVYPTSSTFNGNSLGSYSPIGPHNTLTGRLADFRFYNTVLTDAEIGYIYAGTG
jgi:hypothetical protein